MKERPTPDTDAFFRSFADGDATPSHAEYYDRMTQLERERDEARDTITDVLSALVAMEHEGPRLAALRVRGERDEAREWKDMLSGWGGTPEIVQEFIKGQQARIHAAQDIERELEQAKQDAKQHEVDCLRALGERNEAREEVQRIQHWATVNGTIQMQRELTELTSQREKLAEAAKLIADEYEDRRCQFGGDYLWTKHEQTEAIENALAIINKNE